MFQAQAGFAGLDVTAQVCADTHGLVVLVAIVALSKHAQIVNHVCRSPQYICAVQAPMQAPRSTVAKDVELLILSQIRRLTHWTHSLVRTALMQSMPL